MQISFSTERGRALGAAYIAFIACLTVPITMFRVLHPNGWTPGDWLVNYTGGFVRRGLPGEAILLVAHALHLSPVLLGSLLPLGFYALFYVVVWQMFRRSSGSLWTFAALVSPATLAFPILDPTGAFRKELLLLLALATLLLWLAVRRPRDLPLTLFVTAAGVVCILSHEGMLPFLLYLVGALWLGLGDIRRLLRVLALPAIATVAALLEVLRHRGNLAEEQTICRSLGPAPPLVCSGSIAYLANGTDVARADVLRNIHAYHYLFYYPLLTLLALLPLAIMAWRFARRPRLRPDLWAIAATGLCSLLASLPLFVYAMDWGRWIYIHVFCLFLLLLFVDLREVELREVDLRQAAAADLRGRPETLAGVPGRLRWHRYPGWVAAALIMYATCWNIPHYGNYPKKGYLNVPLHLLKEEMSHRHGHSAPSTTSTSAPSPAMGRTSNIPAATLAVWLPLRPAA